jgi:hypothetical protein
MSGIPDSYFEARLKHIVVRYQAFLKHAKDFSPLERKKRRLAFLKEIRDLKVRRQAVLDADRRGLEVR